MAISERYRQIYDQIEQRADRLYEELPADAAKALRLVDQAAEELQDQLDAVGEIPAQGARPARPGPCLVGSGRSGSGRRRHMGTGAVDLPVAERSVTP